MLKLTMTSPSSTQQQQQQIFPLIKLPRDLQMEIADHLTCLQRIKLKMTSRHFYSLLKPLNHEELLDAECQLFVNRRFSAPMFMACVECLRLRPLGCFARSGKYQDWCLDCEVASKQRSYRYQRGVRIRTRCTHGDKILCVGCGKIGDWVYRYQSQKCRTCFETDDAPLVSAMAQKHSRSPTAREAMQGFCAMDQQRNLHG